METSTGEQDFKNTSTYNESWPKGRNISENLKAVESMSRYMKWAHEQGMLKEISPDDLMAFCCIGTGIDFRSETDARYISVWAPQLSDKVQKVWTVQGLDNYMQAEPHSMPFFFGVNETITSKGKQFFQIRCEKVPPSASADFPQCILEQMEEGIKSNEEGRTVNNSLRSDSRSSGSSPQNKKRRL